MIQSDTDGLIQTSAGGDWLETDCMTDPLVVAVTFDPPVFFKLKPQDVLGNDCGGHEWTFEGPYSIPIPMTDCEPGGGIVLHDFGDSWTAWVRLQWQKVGPLYGECMWVAWFGFTGTIMWHGQPTERTVEMSIWGVYDRSDPSGVLDDDWSCQTSLCVHNDTNDPEAAIVAIP